MGLLTPDGKYNRMAELLADENDISIKVVTFAGTDKTVMLKRTEYGGKCLIVSAKNVLDYMGVIDETKVKVGGFQRKEEKYFDFNCFKEAWLNAIVHNRWINGTPPAVYIYDDKIEIVSDGGLPSALTEEDYFDGVSKPVNERLLRIFSELELIDRTGHGVPLIVKHYGKKIFKISKETVRIFIPLNKELLEKGPDTTNKNPYKNLSKNEIKILNELQNNPSATINALKSVVDLSISTIEKIQKELKEKGYIERVGSKKNGHWNILK